VDFENDSGRKNTAPEKGQSFAVARPVKSQKLVITKNRPQRCDRLTFT